MRHTAYFVHTTLNGRISASDGSFWDPFPWGGDEEMAYNNEFFRGADTWLLGRVCTRASSRGGTPWPRVKSPTTFPA